MKTLRELSITGDAREIDRLIMKIQDAVQDGWQRDADSENRVAAMGGGKMYSFVCTEREERPSAALWLYRDTPEHAMVSNVIPLHKGSLARAEYNQIVAEFHDRLVTPAAAQRSVKVMLTEEDAPIETWLSRNAADLLRQFSRAANRSTGTTHPLDERRWFAFLVEAHKESAPLNAETLQQWLEEEESWPQDEASELAQEYEKERALLAFYAQAA